MEAHRLLRTRISDCLQGFSHRLSVACGRLDALSPLNVLERGYAIARRLPDRRLVTDAAQLREGDGLLVTLRHGEVEAEVQAARGGLSNR